MQFMRVLERISLALATVPEGDAAASLQSALTQSVRDYEALSERQSNAGDPDEARKLEEAMIEHGAAMDALSGSIGRFEEARKKERKERSRVG